MNRQFQAKIQVQNWVLLVAFLFLTVYAAWVKHPVFLMIGLVLMVVLIERMIHTSYIVTEDHLQIHTSRFTADQVIQLLSIQRIDQVNALRLFGKSFHHFLLVVYTDLEGRERQATVMPTNAAEFVSCIQKRREQIVLSTQKEA